MFAKHDPALRDVIPFGDDPYDAVGSFGVIVGMLIALLSLVRAFRPYREAPSTAQRAYLVRSQEAVVLVVFLTLASDVVAMGRHPSMWFGASSRDKLIALIAGMAVVTVAVQFLIRASQEKLPERGAKDWIAAASATLLAIHGPCRLPGATDSPHRDPSAHGGCGRDRALRANATTAERARAVQVRPGPNGDRYRHAANSQQPGSGGALPCLREP